jgi:hypothetical protein
MSASCHTGGTLRWRHAYRDGLKARLWQEQNPIRKAVEQV